MGGSVLVDDQRRFPAAVLRATRAFARSKPWRGTIPERKEKFQAAAESLGKACGITPPSLLFGNVEADRCSGASALRGDTITLRGRLSVVTLLNLMAAAKGLDGAERFGWSLSLFKRCFPISFSRCRFDGRLLRRG